MDELDGRQVAYTYDVLHRLTREASTGGLIGLRTIDHAYYLDGNRTSKTTTAGTETYGYGPGFRLNNTTGPVPATFAYDGSGRTTSLTRSGSTLGLSYDSDDLVTQITNSGSGETASYSYDAAGRRTSASDSAGDRQYLVAPTLGAGLESPQLVVDDGTGAWLASYVYAGEHPVARITPSGPVYYLHDAMGSVIGLADGAGTEVADFRYDAFGVERGATGSAAALPSDLGGDFRYHGQWQERASGLYYVRARNYDPGSGRFLSRDAVEGAFSRPERFHPYSWNSNNPAVLRDPTGLFFTISSLSTGQSIASTLRGLAVNTVRQVAIEKAQGVATSVLVNSIKNLVPASELGSLAELARFLSAADGIGFETAVSKAVCRFLRVDGNAYLDDVRLSVEIRGRSGAGSRGFGCGAVESERASFGGDEEADFVVKKGGNPLKRLPKTYLIGDFKLRLSTGIQGDIDDATRRQFKRYADYAAYSSGNQVAPVVLYVSIVGPGKAAERRFERYLARYKVLPVFAYVVPGKR